MKKDNNLALISLILGIVSFAFLFFNGYESLGLVLGIAAITLGREANRNDNQKSSVAKIGILCGAIGGVLCLIATSIFVITYISSYMENREDFDLIDEIKDEFNVDEDNLDDIESDPGIDVDDSENNSTDLNVDSDVNNNDEPNTDINSDDTNTNQSSDETNINDNNSVNNNDAEIIRLQNELQIKEQQYSQKIEELKKLYEMNSDAVKNGNISEAANYHNEISKLSSEISVLSSEIGDLRQKIFELQW